MAKGMAISGAESAQELRAKVESEDPYTLDAVAVARFVTRYQDGELNETALEEIGDLLEGGEFIEYVGPGADGIIAQVIFQMSTPTANKPITKEAAERWLRLLRD